MSKPNNCPFCGDLVNIQLLDEFWFVKCISCGASGPLQDTKNFAVTWWNFITQSIRQGTSE